MEAEVPDLDSLKLAKTDIEQWANRLSKMRDNLEKMASTPMPAVNDEVWKLLKLMSGDTAILFYFSCRIKMLQKSMESHVEYYKTKLKSTGGHLAKARNLLTDGLKNRKAEELSFKQRKCHKKQRLHNVDVRLNAVEAELTLYKFQEPNSALCTAKETEVAGFKNEKQVLEAGIMSDEKSIADVIAASDESIRIRRTAVDRLERNQRTEEQCVAVAKEALAFLEEAKGHCKHAMNSTSAQFLYILRKLNDATVKIEKLIDISPFLPLSTITELSPSNRSLFTGWSMIFTIDASLEPEILERINILVDPFHVELGKQFSCSWNLVQNHFQFEALPRPPPTTPSASATS